MERERPDRRMVGARTCLPSKHSSLPGRRATSLCFRRVLLPPPAPPGLAERTQPCSPSRGAEGGISLELAWGFIAFPLLLLNTQSSLRAEGRAEPHLSGGTSSLSRAVTLPCSWGQTASLVSVFLLRKRRRAAQRRLRVVGAGEGGTGEGAGRSAGPSGGASRMRGDRTGEEPAVLGQPSGSLEVSGSAVCLWQLLSRLESKKRLSCRGSREAPRGGGWGQKSTINAYSAGPAHAGGVASGLQQARQKEKGQPFQNLFSLVLSRVPRAALGPKKPGKHMFQGALFFARRAGPDGAGGPWPGRLSGRPAHGSALVIPPRSASCLNLSHNQPCRGAALTLSLLL